MTSSYLPATTGALFGRHSRSTPAAKADRTGSRRVLPACLPARRGKTGPVARLCSVAIGLVSVRALRLLQPAGRWRDAAPREDPRRGRRGTHSLCAAVLRRSLSGPENGRAALRSKTFAACVCVGVPSLGLFCPRRAAPAPARPPAHAPRSSSSSSSSPPFFHLSPHIPNYPLPTPRLIDKMQRIALRAPRGLARQAQTGSRNLSTVARAAVAPAGECRAMLRARIQGVEGCKEARGYGEG